jgi:hypothetical protein
MTKLSLFASIVLVPGAVLFACATDNGDAVHGPQFGPPPEPPDGGAIDGTMPQGDSASVPSPEGGPDADAAPSTCTAGTVAVLAGTDTTLTGAVQDKGGAWTGVTITNGAAKSAPSLTAFGTGFIGLTRGAGDALQGTSYGTSWSNATTIGALTTIGAPTVAVASANAESVFLAGAPDTNKFFRIENSGTSWTTTGDPLTPPGGTQSYGPSAGTVAAAGTDLVFAQDGDNQGLYVQTWNGAWSVAAPINGAGTLNTAPPSLLAVDGSFDLVLLYADNTANHVIGYATRNAMTKTWNSAQVTQATAQTSEQLSAFRISQFVIMVTFRGNNQRPYFMTGTLGVGTISWSLPAALLGDTSTVDTPPTVAKGVCGDDAVAVFAAAGQVKATRYRGNAWSVPETVSGASGNRVSVATR